MVTHRERADRVAHDADLIRIRDAGSAHRAGLAPQSRDNPVISPLPLNEKAPAKE
jgi:hypothetical protein